MDTKKLGYLGEKIACGYLVEKGFKILCKNYRINFGEIDIIAVKKPKLLFFSGKVIHFVEVKTLLSQSFHPERAERFEGYVLRQAQNDFFPEEKVNYKKQKKLKQLAEIWLEENKYRQDQPYQIDVIGVLVDKKSKNAKLHYFPNAVNEV